MRINSGLTFSENSLQQLVLNCETPLLFGDVALFVRQLVLQLFTFCTSQIVSIANQVWAGHLNERSKYEEVSGGLGGNSP